MHSQFRTTFKFSEKIDEKAEYQFLIPGVSNFTFYSIYAQITIEKHPNNPLFYKIKESSFYIENFDKLLSVGISNVHPSIKMYYDVVIKKPVYHMIINVMTGISKGKYNNTVNFTPDNSRINLFPPIDFQTAQNIDSGYFSSNYIFLIETINVSNISETDLFCDQNFTKSYGDYNLDISSSYELLKAKTNETNGTIDIRNCHPGYVKFED